MVSTTLVLAALASLAAAMPSVQRRQDPAYEQCVNAVNYFTTALRLPCRPLAEPPVGSACAYCCYPVEGIPTLDTIPPVNCHKASTPEELERVQQCTDATLDGYVCEPSVQ